MDKSSTTLTKEECNDEPVVYCKHCLSLSIRVFGGIDYCDKCGSTEMEESSIEDWDQLYQKKYNQKYL